MRFGMCPIQAPTACKGGENSIAISERLTEMVFAYNWSPKNAEVKQHCPLNHGGELGSPSLKIGRASCRERVYVLV
jgi:hypothetical protein